MRKVFIKTLLKFGLVLLLVFVLQNEPPKRSEAYKVEPPKPAVTTATVSQSQVAPTVTPAPTVSQQPASPPPTPQPVYGSGCGWLSGVLQTYGITGADLNAALNIATRESGCRQNAVNAGGGACNVFQELPCGKWGGVDDLAGHIRGADAYAKARYGGWQGAWASWQSKHWW